MTFKALRGVCLAMIAGVFIMGVVGAVIFPGIVEPTMPLSEALSRGFQTWMIFALASFLHIPPAVVTGVVLLKPRAGWSYQGGVLRREPMGEAKPESLEDFSNRVRTGLTVIAALIEGVGVMGMVGLLMGMPMVLGLAFLGSSLLLLPIVLMQVGEFERFIEELQKVEASSAEDS
jgi:hypothetical protein